jgi:hypothetical protein
LLPLLLLSAIVVAAAAACVAAVVGIWDECVQRGRRVCPSGEKGSFHARASQYEEKGEIWTQ